MTDEKANADEGVDMQAVKAAADIMSYGGLISSNLWGGKVLSVEEKDQLVWIRYWLCSLANTL